MTIFEYWAFKYKSKKFNRLLSKIEKNIKDIQNDISDKK